MLNNVEESAETEIKPNVNVKELLKDNNETTAHEISALLRQVCSKFSDYDCQASKKLENALIEIKRLESVINNLNKKQCSKCVELVGITRALRKTLKEKDDTIAVVGKLLTNNPSKNSYALASQMVVDAIMMPAVDFTYFDSMYPEVELSSKENLEKTPEKIEIVNTEVSPVVLKRTRSNKRRFLSISSKKKNKTENGDTAADTYTSYADDYAEFGELSLLNIASGCLKTPENLNSIMECVTPLDSIHRAENTLEQSPEILNRTVEIRNDRLSSGKLCSNSDEKPKFSPEMRNSDVKFNRLSIEKICADLGVNNLCQRSPPLGTELTNRDVIMPSNQPSTEMKSDVKKENYQFKALSTLNVNVLNNVNATSAHSEHAKNTKATELEKQKQKTVWNLKKSRELTNKKLKQTVLSTMVYEKKLDISTLKEYNGGSIPCSQIKKPERIFGDSMTSKEGTIKNDETFFDPLAASTNNNLHSESTAQVGQEDNPMSPKNNEPTELTNKLRTPTKDGFSRFQDSFDYLPSKSPKYAYRRDAVRKKSERLKLPGQECDDCIQFYESRKGEMSDSQIKALLNKCSRHRDKYAIRLNTPPGLWNPVFDDTDEEIELK